MLTLARAAGDAPGIQVLSPGFSVEELSLRLTNINNLVFAPDGRLFALGYDGRVHVLRDTDGDGREDRAEPFWDKPTLQVPVGMVWSPEGIYIASHGKLSLLIDSDGDGKADREEVIAADWVPPDNHSGGVDAIGLARDSEGNLFFGLGCADYSNAYRVHDGQAHYDLKSERGTILKLTADRKHREIVCTGTRFPYGIAFNRHGDLFATEQEGETWLPGGNPLDELNLIVPGRHYGFPPRHDEYLPHAIDEPPLIGFGPQHQSACGLCFNEPGPARKVFGPASWEGDAFVAGFSRGKIWRVRLAKTSTGYVGKQTLFAASSMLVADVTISPRGDLYASCHGGDPDWGSGPNGEGRIFRIRRVDRDAPQAVIAWAASPLEVRISFDRSIDAKTLEGLVGSTIDFGEHVRAADRLEVHRPGYAAVKAQLDLPRGKLRIAAASLEDDGWTMRLVTDPHPLAVTYALRLPGVSADIDYDLCGVEASWEGSSSARWSGWLPSVDLEVSRAFTKGSRQHADLDARLREAGRLTLRTKIDLTRRLYRPADDVKLLLEAHAPFEASLDAAKPLRSRAEDGLHRLELAATGRSELSLVVSLATAPGTAEASLHASYASADDPYRRPLPLAMQLLPWAPARSVTGSIQPTPAGSQPELAGGDRVRGEAIFYGEKARCSVCHVLQGRGGMIGPDLSNLAQRDAASVLRDITEPSATINPDYVPYTLVLRDGSVVTGITRAEGADSVRVADASAKETVVRRADIAELRPEGASIMPADLAKSIGDAGMKDLLTFLLTEARPLRVVLVATAQDHGAGEHDYPAWQKKWAKLLGSAKRVSASTADGWPSREEWEKADLVVFYFWNHDWSRERFADLDAFLDRGGGAVFLHAAVIADKDPEILAERIGLAAHPVRTKYRHGELDLKATSQEGSAISIELKQIHLADETYWPMIGDASKVKVLATAEEEGEARPMLWTFEHGKGRVFCSVLGHYTATLDDPRFRLLILRGISWAAGEPQRRLDALATEDAAVR